MLRLLLCLWLVAPALARAASDLSMAQWTGESDVLTATSGKASPLHNGSRTNALVALLEKREVSVEYVPESASKSLGRPLSEESIDHLFELSENLVDPDYGDHKNGR